MKINTFPLPARGLVAVALGLAAVGATAQRVPPATERSAAAALPRPAAGGPAWSQQPVPPASVPRSSPPSSPIQSSTSPPAETFDPAFSLRMLDNDVSAFGAAFAKHQHTHLKSQAALQQVDVDIWPDTAEDIGQGIVDVFTLGQGRRAGGVVRRQRTVRFLGFPQGGELTTSGITAPPCGFQLDRSAPECQPVDRH